jgi:hypothetical protein
VWWRSGLEALFLSTKDMPWSAPYWERYTTSDVFGFSYRGLRRCNIILRNTKFLEWVRRLVLTRRAMHL